MKFIFVSLFLFSAAQADRSCTDWTQTKSVSCIFAGSFANLWQRQCLNPCGFRHGSNDCDNESICVDPKTNPNNLSSHCTDWSKESSVTCLNPNTGDWEQKWVRACQTGVATSWCSDNKPDLH